MTANVASLLNSVWGEGDINIYFMFHNTPSARREGGFKHQPKLWFHTFSYLELYTPQVQKKRIMAFTRRVSKFRSRVLLEDDIQPHTER